VMPISKRKEKHQRARWGLCPPVPLAPMPVSSTRKHESIHTSKQWIKKWIHKSKQRIEYLFSFELQKTS
jgi:hypothetical protein